MPGTAYREGMGVKVFAIYEILVCALVGAKFSYL